jgi:hypothetical protein
LVAASDAYTRSSSSSLRPAKHDKPSRTRFQRSAAEAPATRLVVAIAPELTMGLVVWSARSSTCAADPYNSEKREPAHWQAKPAYSVQQRHCNSLTKGANQRSTPLLQRFLGVD